MYNIFNFFSVNHIFNGFNFIFSITVENVISFNLPIIFLVKSLCFKALRFFIGLLNFLINVNLVFIIGF